MTTPTSEPSTVHVWAVGKRVGLGRGEGYYLTVQVDGGARLLNGHYILQAEDNSWASYDNHGVLVATGTSRGGTCAKHAHIMERRVNEETL